MAKKVMELKEITKEFHTAKEKIEVLKGINYTFEKGKLYGIKGHSGSGKSTLIKILGLLDEPTSGEYKLYNNEIKNLNDKKLSYYRMKYIGFIFQEYNLDQYLKASENVMVPMLINKDIEKQKREERAIKLLKKVKLEQRANHFPKELSGGEQQRVAIARALANNPEILIADEPTGNLDKKNEKIIFELLKEMTKEDKCVIVVSHSNDIEKYADILLSLEDGNLIEVKNDKR